MAVAVLLLGVAAIAVQVRQPWSADSTGSSSAGPTGDQGAAAPPAATGASPVPGTDNGSWLAATNAYCRNTTDPALKRVMADSSNDEASYLTRLASINRQLDARLRASVPSGLRADVEQIASDWDRMASLYDQAATAVRGGDQAKALSYASQGDDANQAGNELALKIGLPDCANAGGIGVAAPSTTPGSI